MNVPMCIPFLAHKLPPILFLPPLYYYFFIIYLALSVCMVLHKEQHKEQHYMGQVNPTCDKRKGKGGERGTAGKEKQGGTMQLVSTVL